MKFVRNIRFAIALIGLSLIPSTVQAETPFIADELIYNSNTLEIIARGSVEIDSEQGYFYLDQLNYDINTGAMTIEGNVRGVLPSGERIMSDFAFLAKDNKELILRNAQILLSSQLQIVASRIKETGIATIGENITVTSCEVCIINPVPIWQIKADQVYRDKTQSKIYFKNAHFETFGFPILYLPKFRIPDAGVERMSGFLRPELIISDLFESGVRIPYFHVIDESSDILLTPYITLSNVFNVEGRYRNYIKGGKIQLDGAYSFNDGDDEFGRYYIQSSFEGNLTKNISIDMMYTLNSDNNFAPNFSYENTGTNHIKLDQTSNTQDFSLGVIDYRPTTIARERRNNPLLLPSLEYRRNQQIGLGTAFYSDFSVLGLINEDDDDVLRFGTSLGVDKVYSLPFGVAVKTQFGARAQAYALGEFEEDDLDLATRVSPIMSIDATLPLAKTDSNGSTLLVPRAQLVWSKNYESGADIPNSDAHFIDHDYFTLFGTNQYSGQDRLESGLRLKLGASYVYQSHSGYDFDMGFGKVTRITADETFEDFADSSIDDEEWVGYVNYVTPDDYSLYARGSWNSDFEISRAEIGFDYTKDDYSITIGAVHLEAEPENGYDEKRQEASIDGFYHFAPNWQANFGLQYDLVNTYALDASIDLTYGNECIEVTAGFVQDFNRGEGIDEETTFEFDVILIGLGQKPKRDWPRRQCSSMSLLN